MQYLVISLDDEVTEETTLHEDDVIDALEGDICVYRFHEGHFQKLTPIDEQDSNNWTNV